jgi:hypothetical protein
VTIFPPEGLATLLTNAGCTSEEDIDGCCPELVSGGHVVAHEPVHAIFPPFSGLNT